MVMISARYEGSLRCTASHGPSASTLVTDAPLDNHGRGEAFSPTDLVATALGTCILTTMAIAANRLGTSIEGAEAITEKIMTATPTRRIGQLRCRITMPAGIDAGHHPALINAAERCPVKESIHPDTEVVLEWVWG